MLHTCLAVLLLLGYYHIESGIYILKIDNVDVSGDVNIVSEVVEILLNS